MEAFEEKNLSGLMSRPAALQERIFTRVFEQAEIAKFSSLELKQYEDSISLLVNYLHFGKHVRALQLMRDNSLVYPP